MRVKKATMISTANKKQSVLNVFIDRHYTPMKWMLMFFFDVELTGCQVLSAIQGYWRRLVDCIQEMEHLICYKFYGFPDFFIQFFQLNFAGKHCP